MQEQYCLLQPVQTNSGVLISGWIYPAELVPDWAKADPAIAIRVEEDPDAHS